MTAFISKTFAFCLACVFLLAGFGWIAMNLLFGIAILKAIFHIIF